MDARNDRLLSLSDEEVLFVLRKAAEEAHQTAGQTRALICETRSLLRKAERLKMPLIESR
jgi:hypothetical protein